MEIIQEHYIIFIFPTELLEDFPKIIKNDIVKVFIKFRSAVYKVLTMLVVSLLKLSLIII